MSRERRAVDVGAFRKCLCTTLAASIAVAPTHGLLAFESAAPTEAFTFGDQTPAAQLNLDVGAKATASKSRTVPVSASGTYSTSVAIDVPPGRLAMTPSVSLGYDSGAAQRESAVGLGWSLSQRAITRSVRRGFPAADLTSSGGYVYRESSAVYDSPSGELIEASPGVAVPTYAGAPYTPLREGAPVRYSRITQAGKTRWVEHDPSGIKRYYGADPFASTEAKLTTELGEHSWLLLREEDPHGNAITYEYHDIADQNRADKAVAQTQPILKKVSWGQNRLTGLGVQFTVTTTLQPQNGPLDMLHGHTLLRSKVSEIIVGKPSTEYWRYKLNYQTSPSTNRQLLWSVERTDGSGAYATSRKTTFHYDPGGPAFEEWQDIDLGLAYKLYFHTTDVLHVSRESLEGAAESKGFRSGARFLDYDGDGRTDSLYHGAGLGMPQARVLPEASKFGCAPQGNADICLGPPGTLPAMRGSDLADLDADGDLDLMAFGEQVDVCGKNAAPPPWTGPTPIPNDPSSPLITINPSHASGSSPASDFLPGWPQWVRRKGRILVESVELSNPIPKDELMYTPLLWSDFTVPLADLNADGRPDVSLLKYFEDPLGAQAETVGLNCESYGGKSNGIIFGETSDGFSSTPPFSISKALAQKLAALPRQTAPAQLLQYLAQVYTPEEMTILAETPMWVQVPEDLRNEIEEEDPIMPMGGELGDLGFDPGDLGMPDPEDDMPFYKPGIWYTGDSIGDGPEGSWPGGGMYEECGYENFPRSYNFVPKVWLAAGTEELQYDDYRGFPFTRSIELAADWPGVGLDMEFVQRIAWGWVGYGVQAVGPDGCPIQVHEPYARQADSNAFLVDFNGDTLPDLVLGEPLVKLPPSQGDLFVCSGGHRVLLNRGYRFEHRWPAEVQASAWADSPYKAEGWSGKLASIRNRSFKCAGATPTKFVDSPGTAAQALVGQVPAPSEMPDAFGVPMSAVSFSDVDADGRTDAVVLYDIKRGHIPGPACDKPGTSVPCPKQVRKLLRNTGRGFEELSPSAAGIPEQFFLSSTLMLPSPPTEHRAWKNLTAPDAGRLADLDGDGLLDLVEPGEDCQAGVAGCNDKLPRWARNKGKAPDMLGLVESSTGAWTEIRYGTPLAANVSYPTSGTRPPASARVVTEMRIGSVPDGSTLAGATPVQGITFAYHNYVRDPVSLESLGFEQVTAHFWNQFDGEMRETVTVSQIYDVRPEVAGTSVRHPLKGAVVQTLTGSSDLPGEQIASASDFELSALGDAVRIRPRSSVTQHCTSSGCVESGSEVLAWDPHGFATEVRHGEFDNGQLQTSGSSRVLRTHEHQATSWILGLPASETVRGDHYDIHGTKTPDAVLAQRAVTFYPGSGLLHTSSRPDFQAAGCESAGTEDTVTLQYTPEGLPHQITTPRGMVDTTMYAADKLYPTQRQTSVTRYLDGAPVGATTLTSKVDFDRRTGVPLSVEDANGNRQKFESDSLGRPRRESIIAAATVASPGPLREMTYDDDTTPTVDIKSYRAPGVFTTERTHLDGLGRELGTVEGVAGDFVRTDFIRYDAFGNVVESALPEQSSGLGNYVVTSDARRVLTSTDGLGRIRSVTAPNGETVHHAFDLRQIIETSPKGTSTRRVYDWRGDLVLVERRDDYAVPRSTHSIIRDGGGRVAGIVDADGTLRRYERDGGGRVRFASLPHRPDAASEARTFAYCHDVEDVLVRSQSPAGRVTDIELDEAGRPVSTFHSGEGAATASHRSYDNPTTPNGRGRLTRVTDAVGVTTHEYDRFGRPAKTVQDFSAAVDPQMRKYGVQYVYDQAGLVESVWLDALTPTVVLTYTRDARGRVLKVASDGETLVHDVETDAEERLRGATFGNGVVATWEYDDLTQDLVEVEYSHQGASVAKVEYLDHDAHGNIGRERRYGASAALLSDKLHAYDALDRLASTSIWTPLASSADTFLYSPSGNILDAGGAAYTYGDDLLPQAVTGIAGSQAHHLDYDADGNVGKHFIDGEGSNLEWDAAGCLTSILQAGGEGDRFVCSDAGETVARRAAAGGGRVVEIPGLGQLRLDEGVLLLRVPVAGTALVQDVRFFGNGERDKDRSGYLLGDARSSVLARAPYDADPGFDFDEEAEYAAWGITESVSSAPVPMHQFTGVEPAATSGVYHFGARAYDPVLRRWLSPDPLLLVTPQVDLDVGDNLNLYQYAANNPVNLVDPDGRNPAAIAAAGAAVAACSRSPQCARAVSQAATTVAVGAASVLAATGATAAMSKAFDWLKRPAPPKSGGSDPPTTEPPAPKGGGGKLPDAVKGPAIGGAAKLGKDYLEKHTNQLKAGADAATAKADAIASRALGKVHHVMTNKNFISKARGGPWSPRFDDMAKRAGMSLDDVANKVSIVGHKGPHPQEYHQIVLDRLTSATANLEGPVYQAAFKAELNKISRDAATPGHPLNKLVTKTQ